MAKQQRERCVDFVRAWLSRYGGKFNPKNFDVSYNNGDGATIIEQIWVDANQQGHNFKKDDIGNVLEIWKRDQHREVLREHLQKLCAGTLPADQEWNTLIEAITRNQSVNNIVHILALQHFIWQVKRKLCDLEVQDHMMIVLCGKTGSGKSMFLKRFLSPVKDLVYSAPSLDCFSDDRQYHLFGRYYVMFFDEMAKAGSMSDVALIKGVISSDCVPYRKFYTQSNVSPRNLSTCIGTSNHGILDVIYDPTSARRFWEIETADRIDWSIVNNMDMMMLWNSVNQIVDSPIKRIIGDVQKYQEDNLRVKDSIEVFLEEWSFDKDSYVWGEHWYNTYQAFCKRNGYDHPVSSQKFFNKVSIFIKQKYKLKNKDEFQKKVKGVWCYRMKSIPVSIAEVSDAMLPGGAGTKLIALGDEPTWNKPETSEKSKELRAEQRRVIDEAMAMSALKNKELSEERSKRSVDEAIANSLNPQAEASSDIPDYINDGLPSSTTKKGG